MFNSNVEWQPSFDEVMTERTVLDTSTTCELCEGENNVVDGDRNISAFIIRLRDAVSPHTVFRLVVPVPVFAFKRVLFRWGRTHIGNKLREVISPFAAHSNSFLSVKTVPRVSRIVTAPLCMRPCSVLFRSHQPVFALHRAEFRFQASTAFRMPSPKLASRNARSLSAVAITEPAHLPVMSSMADRKCYESAEALPC